MIIEKQVENIEKRTFLLFFDNFLSIYFVGLKIYLSLHIEKR